MSKSKHNDGIWYPYTQIDEWNTINKKITIRKGKGFYFYDKNGKKYLDGIANMWCNVWGFSENSITRAMQNQINLIPHSTLFGLGNEKSIEFSKEFLKIAKGMDKLFFTDNGSSAIEVALKIAIQYWLNGGILNKKKFLSLKDGYHGDTIGAMSVGYVDKYFRSFKSLLIKCKTIPKPYVDIECENENEKVKAILESSEKIINENCDNTAALIMESGAQIAGGVLIYPNDYQKKIKELCDKYNVLLILDEIATGFGRLGNMIEYLYQESTPDIVCYGKALTGGYFPLAITLTSNKIYNMFNGNYLDQRHLYHGHTYTGHPIGCAAALENLKMYRKNNLIKKIDKNSNLIKKRIEEFDKISIIKNIRSKGLLGGMDLIYDKKPISIIDSMPINFFIMKESLNEGIFLRSLGNTIVIIPPLAIDSNSLNKIIDIQLKIVKKIEKKVLNLT